MVTSMSFEVAKCCEGAIILQAAHIFFGGPQVTSRKTPCGGPFVEKRHPHSACRASTSKWCSLRSGKDIEDNE